MRHPSHTHWIALLMVFSLPTALGGWEVAAQDTSQDVKIGIIGLDTSHSIAFTKIINNPDDADMAGFRVVAAYPQGSTTIASSYERIPRYTEEIQAMGVAVVGSIDALLDTADVVLLLTNDGWPHREQALAAIAAGKPLFIDKPIAGSLADAITIFDAAQEAGVPVFSSSGLRFMTTAQAVRQGSIGTVIGADTYSPAPVEPSHPDLFWYGIHGVETLFTVMGAGCETVQRIHTEGTDVIIGIWEGNRIGTVRGLRDGKRDYGGTAFGSEGIAPLGPFEGYRPMMVALLTFFRTGLAPVTPEETLALYAFMEAADESKKQGGAVVALAQVLQEARAEAKGMK